ncbi:MAG: DUF6804 family protein [Phycisphaerales bacterium JB039]
MHKYRRRGYEGIFVDDVLGERFYVSRKHRRVFLYEPDGNAIRLLGEMDFDQFAAVTDPQEAKTWIEAARWGGRGTRFAPHRSLPIALGEVTPRGPQGPSRPETRRSAAGPAHSEPVRGELVVGSERLAPGRPARHSGPAGSKSGDPVPIAFLFGLVAVLCGLALKDMPYGYYTFLRFAVTVAAIVAIVTLRLGNSVLAWVWLIVGLLFNPVIVIHLARSTWAGIDVAVAGLSGLTALVLLDRYG